MGPDPNLLGRSAATATPALDIAAPGVRLRTLVNLRWIAVIGQFSALFIVRFYLGYPLELLPALALVAASVALNVGLLLRYPPATHLTTRQASFQFAFDLLQLAGLLYLTGGLENPFAVLMIVPATISATILSLRATISLVALAIACLLVLARLYLPLPWGGDPPNFPDTYLLGIWLALTTSMVFVAAYAWRVSAEARRRAQALAATQAALAREQRLSALGSLAAAAAHELGTPLGSITLVSKELIAEYGENPELAAELQVLHGEALRCREILENLSRRAAREDQHFKRAPIAALVSEAGRPHEEDGVEIVYTAQAEGGSEAPQPVVARRPEILHALDNFIHNAVRFARGRVHVDLSWDAARVHLVISDDGPGFAIDILEDLGEPYLPSRPGTRGGKDGLGLGVFIATTLLERTGASIIFLNDVDGGAVVDITWPRPAIEEKGDAWETLKS